MTEGQHQSRAFVDFGGSSYIARGLPVFGGFFGDRQYLARNQTATTWQKAPGSADFSNKTRGFRHRGDRI